MTPAPLVPLSAFGGASGATLLWHQAGQLWLTAILKVQLALVPDDVATLIHGAEIHRDDSPSEAGPNRALDIPTDLVPGAPGAEILLAGHACAPVGQPSASISVRLFVGGDDGSLVDKTLHVYGDRPRANAPPIPFSRMPLAYERAVGGPNTDNPVGRSLHDPGQPPNLVHPVDPWVIAGFGPIAPSWPQRVRLARSRPVVRGSILDIPDDLPIEYFLAAPRDQRVARIGGDEWIICDGMHPELPRFQSQLPALQVRARVARTGESTGEQAPIELMITRLYIDMDHARAELTWRGNIAVRSDEVQRLQVMAGVESAPDDMPLDLASETMMLSEDQLASAFGIEALPWKTKPVAPATPRKSQPGKALLGLPFVAPPKAAGALGIAFSQPETTADGEPVVAAPLAGTAAPRPPPSYRDVSSEVTITNIDEGLLAALPFARRQADKAAAPVFDVPRLNDDDSGEEEGLTQVTPAGANAFPARSALPFHAAGSTAPSAAVNPSSPMRSPHVPSAHGPSAVGIGAPPDNRATQPEMPAPHLSPTGPLAIASAGAGAAEPPETALLFGTTLEPPTAKDAPPFEDEPSAPTPAPAPRAAPTASVEPAPAAAAAPAPAAEPAHPGESGIRKTVLDNVRAGIAMHGMDLSSADLSGLDLTGAVLSDARLSGAKLMNTVLRKARLGGAKLMGADLRGADLSEADLSRADLTRATLTDAILDKADLADANLTLAQAANAKLRGARADRANFVQAHLGHASLESISVRDADFSGASVANASFKNATIHSGRFSEARGEYVRFDGAQLDGAIFTGASLEDASFVGIVAPRTNWERAVLDRTVFDRASLKDATFARASLEVSSFLGADLTKADLSSISADGADFTDAKLSGSDLRMSKLSDARLENATLRDANAQKVIANGARLEGADLQKASLRGARMKGCDLARTKLEGTDLRDADLEGAKFEGVDVSKAKLAGANLKGAQGI